VTGLLAGLSRRQLLVVLCLCSWIALVASGYIVLGIWIISVDGSYRAFEADAAIRFLRDILRFSWETYFVALAFVHALALVMLLAPAVRPVEIRPSGRPLLWSVIGASAIGGVSSLLVLGILAEAAWALSVPPGEGKPLGEILISPLVLLPAWSISGGIWAFALRRTGSSRSPDSVDHLFRRVFATTAAESALALPLYLMMRRRNNCECALASFVGLIWGIATLVWMCGPWALLFVTRESRRNWGRAACPACGYPRKSHATVCSECGHAFAGAAAAAADADA
jgi:hypothetical protein